MITPRIVITDTKKIVGKRMTMSYSDYRIGDLWRAFLPARKRISNQLNNDLISMVIYQPNHFTDFKPGNMFERWAAVAVSEFHNVPQDLEAFILQPGMYAVFHYKGAASDSSVFQYIYGTWIPSSDYLLDDLPHFEVLGEKYNNDDASSEEEIWIPVKPRK